jgi:hypothetical protein
MVPIREEGWKEVKLTTVSEVVVKPAQDREPHSNRSDRREQEALVHLHRYSYQVRLWQADEIEQYQYLEGLR